MNTYMEVQLPTQRSDFNPWKLRIFLFWFQSFYIGLESPFYPRFITFRFVRLFSKVVMCGFGTLSLDLDLCIYNYIFAWFEQLNQYIDYCIW